jgi:hypothetical protein
MQPRQAGLVVNAPDAALSALKFNGPGLTAGQQQFNALLAQSEALALKMEGVQTMADAHRPMHWRTLRPLLDQREALMRDTALWLHERLGGTGLSRAQRQIADEVICNLSAAFAQRDDDSMRTLHAAHSPDTPGDRARARARAFADDAMAAPDGGAASASAGDVLETAEEQLRQRAQTHQAARAAHKARRTQSARQRQAAQQLTDAEGALRKIFRQLASALHPDRESDPAERARKNALMSEANAAHDRRDLPALLQLQLRAELAGADKLAGLARDKLAALTRLLQERVEVLTFELRKLEAQVRAEFGLPDQVPLNPAGLKRHLQAQKHHLLADLAAMARDLRLLQDDDHLKQWLRAQHKFARTWDADDSEAP